MRKPMKTIDGKRCWGMWFRRRIRALLGMPEFTNYRCSNCGYTPRTDKLFTGRHCVSCGKNDLAVISWEEALKG